VKQTLDRPGPAGRAWSRGKDGWILGRRLRRLRRLDFDERPASTSPGSVLISVTSHRARYSSLELALRSLLDQSRPADATILWVANEDRLHLPPGVGMLTRTGLEIRTLDRDRGAASKLLPALAAYHDHLIVTADDDVIYSRDWLWSLLRAHAARPAAIVCRRAHYLTFSEDGVLLPYSAWQHETRQVGPDSRLFFTGHGGVLYPPGALSECVLDDALRVSLCPAADDVWFNWMARLAGTELIRTKGATPRHDTVPGSQATTLLADNVTGGGNDRQIREMIRHFGGLDPQTGHVL
jgi:hypothetical protein